MPNLINDQGYNGLGGLAQNYRRTRWGNSQHGTRQMQLYEIHVYGLSDLAVDVVSTNYRDIILDNTDDIDQPAIAEASANSVLDAVIRGVQVMAEIYSVGVPETNTGEGPNDNDLVITVGVAADTVSSLWEQFELDVDGGQNTNPGAASIVNSIGESVDAWCLENATSFSGLDVYPAFITGDLTDTNGPVALAKTDPTVVALKEARQAVYAAQRAANASAGRVGYTPKSQR